MSLTWKLCFEFTLVAPSLAPDDGPPPFAADATASGSSSGGGGGGGGGGVPGRLVGDASGSLPVPTHGVRPQPTLGFGPLTSGGGGGSSVTGGSGHGGGGGGGYRGAAGAVEVLRWSTDVEVVPSRLPPSRPMAFGAVIAGGPRQWAAALQQAGTSGIATTGTGVGAGSADAGAGSVDATREAAVGMAGFEYFPVSASHSRTMRIAVPKT